MADPVALLQKRLGAAFEAHRDDERAAAMSRYMRGLFPYYGIPNPSLQAILRAACEDLGPLSEDRLRRFALAAWRRDQREWQYVACGTLRRGAGRLTPRFVPTLRKLVTTRSWWDTVDTLASHVAGPLVAAHGLRSTMDAWLRDENMWLVRVALLHQLGSKTATDAGWLFGACLVQADHPDFFVRKAIGWALRQYSWTDPDAVRSFLDEHGRRLSPLSRREASKRL